MIFSQCNWWVALSAFGKPLLVGLVGFAIWGLFKLHNLFWRNFNKGR